MALEALLCLGFAKQCTISGHVAEVALPVVLPGQLWVELRRVDGLSCDSKGLKRRQRAAREVKHPSGKRRDVIFVTKLGDELLREGLKHGILPSGVRQLKRVRAHLSASGIRDNLTAEGERKRLKTKARGERWKSKHTDLTEEVDKAPNRRVRIEDRVVSGTPDEQRVAALQDLGCQDGGQEINTVNLCRIHRQPSCKRSMFFVTGKVRGIAGLKERKLKQGGLLGKNASSQVLIHRAGPCHNVKEAAFRENQNQRGMRMVTGPTTRAWQASRSPEAALWLPRTICSRPSASMRFSTPVTTETLQVPQEAIPPQ